MVVQSNGGKIKVGGETAVAKIGIILTRKKRRVILRDRVEMTPSTAWRDGRVDDCDGLENRSRQQPTEGSNPSPSALRFTNRV